MLLRNGWTLSPIDSRLQLARSVGVALLHAADVIPAMCDQELAALVSPPPAFARRPRTLARPACLRFFVSFSCLLDFCFLQ